MEKLGREVGTTRGGGGSRTSDHPTYPIKRNKELRAKRVPSPHHRRAYDGPPPFPQPGWAAARARVQPSNPRGTEVPVDPLELGEWPSRAEPPPVCVWGRSGPLGGAGRGRSHRGPRPLRQGVLQGPPQAGGGLCLRHLRFGKAPARVQDGGERVGSQALATRSAPLCLHCSRGRGGGAGDTARPPPRSGQ